MPVRHLRPVFYNIEGDQSIQSGWINPRTRDIFTTLPGNEMAVETVPRARPAFQTGECVEFPERIDLYPAESIRPHERGTVASWDIESGVVSIFLGSSHEGLDGNTLAISPFHDDWIVRNLKRDKVGSGQAPVRELRGWRAVAARALGLVAAGAPWLLAQAQGLSETVGALTDFLY